MLRDDPNDAERENCAGGRENCRLAICRWLPT